MDTASRHPAIGSARAGVFFGLVLIVAGTVLLLERFGVLRFNLLSHFWPVLWILLGLNLVVSQRGNGGKGIGLLLMSIGVTLELQRFGIIHVRMRDLWPVYIIALGVFLLIRALRPPGPASANENADSRLSEYAILGGGDFRYTSQNFEGGSMTAVMGGIEADLSRARITSSPAVLYVDAILGGVELRVPPEWRVTFNGTAVLGGYDSKVLPPPDDASQPRQELVIRGLALLGGVGVKN